MNTMPEWAIPSILLHPLLFSDGRIIETQVLMCAYQSNPDEPKIVPFSTPSLNPDFTISSKHQDQLIDNAEKISTG